MKTSAKHCGLVVGP